MKLGITQFVLALSLFCNPMAALAVTAVDMLDAENSAKGQIPCQTDMHQSRIADHVTEGEQANSVDCCSCCNSDDCGMDLSCQSCLNLHISAMLLETLELRFSIALQRNLEKVTGHIPGRPILPEIHPPAPLHIS